MNERVEIQRPAQRLPDRSDFTRAKAAYAAGDGIEHLIVGQSWGKPFAEWLQDQDG